MIHSRTLQSFSTPRLWERLSVLQNFRAYSTQYENGNKAADLDAAREWFRHFSKSSIPAKIAQTTFVRSSGPGGQKTNKTSSKAMTVWPLRILRGHVPKILHHGLRSSRFYVSSSDSISISCDTARNQTSNAEETHTRLYEEIIQIYKRRVPGVTSPEQKKKVEQLKKAENTVRLKAKKMHSNKKRLRSSGGGRCGD
ncbi:hypothetical protein QTJ16_002011 [Diplocarpon rosae]|uniref:Prokaryotic-type class I peptide chain release factors domain-containing protein n=1 Tax=Diplocarpon rosae TaxID=946125 RepID=A0AAD9WG51_9HELO|nr:hypothetical protein QTJ16_002011 [Diplocarpon rosae]PBP16851.1 peptidyl-tRNA hydrolase domain-containing protein [Diplocarpon rosae]